MRGFPGRAALRTLPLIVAPIVVGSAWRLTIKPSTGIVPRLLDEWLGYDLSIGSNAPAAHVLTAIMDVWRWIPLAALTLLVASSRRPRNPPSRRGSTARALQILRQVTLPMIRPTIPATVFVRLMDALRTVDEVWTLTGGGPGASTLHVGLRISRLVFPKTDCGYGSAISVVVLHRTLVLCWVLHVAPAAPPPARRSRDRHDRRGRDGSAATLR